MERRAKRLRPVDPEDPIEQPAKRPRFSNYEAPIQLHAKSLNFNSGSATTIPRKASFAGSLFTALNRPFYVPLLRLPPELRNIIWQYALHVDEDGGLCKINEGEEFPEPALLSTCTQIRREAIGIFYSENTFKFTVMSYSPKIPILMLRKSISLNQRYGIKVLKHIKRSYRGPPRWNNVLSWMKAIHEAPRDSPIIAPHGPHKPRTKPTDSITANQLRLYKERDVLAGLFRMVFEMLDRPWHVVELLLGLMRPGLEMFNPEWAVN